MVYDYFALHSRAVEAAEEVPIEVPRHLVLQKQHLINIMSHPPPEGTGNYLTVAVG